MMFEKQGVAPKSVGIARTAVGVVLAIAVCGTAANAQRKAPEGYEVLILSGGQREHHGYREQTQYLQRVLEETGKVQVTICEEADVLRTDAMSKYDCIVINGDRRDAEFRLTEKQQAALLEMVSRGKGCVSVHGFCCAARDWKPEMRQLLGGVLAHFGQPDTKVRQGHYRVKISKPDHPIVQGVADFEIDDELYYDLQIAGELDPIATVAFEGGQWPVAWTRRFGEGRVFVTPLGHKGWKSGSPDPQQNSAFRRMLAQGIIWACGGKGSESNAGAGG
jgi:type 1 glutamine amidotransferase